MTTEKPANRTANGTANGSHYQAWPEKESSAQKNQSQSSWTDAEWSLYTRIVFAVVLIALSFALVPFVEPRIVDPFRHILLIDPLFGLFLYWPLSRVLIRASNLFWGHFLSLLPSIILIGLRFYGSERDAVFGNQPNLPFGTMIFLGVCSMAAYLLFRTPPPSRQ